jgi:hypothetical protein
MMLFRCLAHVVLISALAAGCNQSLFDDGTGDDTPPDADPSQPPVPDAREGTRDADMGGSDGGGVIPDDGGVSPDDGGVPPDTGGDCPGTCINDDAFASFNGVQGGMNGRWRYVEYLPETNSYDNMARVDFADLAGFTGSGTPAPNLVFCLASTIDTPCAGLPGTSLALTTTAPGAHHPALMWTVPYSGTYTVDVRYATKPDAPGIQATLVLAHNDQSNVVDSTPFNPAGGTLYGEPTTTAGEVIVLSVITESETSVSVGVNVVITGPY